jgi:hypothetical protein
MILSRPIATLTLLGCAWQGAVAAETASRTAQPYYAYPSEGVGAGRSAWESGAYPARPATPGSAAGVGGFAQGFDRGGTYAPPSSGATSSGSPRDKPFEQYRFRRRPEDRAAEPQDALKYRPDPDLARRSYQNWGVPGQEWSDAARGPAVIFRPQDGESTASRRSQPGPALPEPPGVPSPYAPDWPAPYGPPY